MGAKTLAILTDARVISGDLTTLNLRETTMIHGNVELHNIEEVREAPGPGGVRLQRVPESVRACLNEGAQVRMLNPACAEIRFVSEGPTASVTLSSEGKTEVVVFRGVFQTGDRYTVTQKPRTIKLTRDHPMDRLTPEQTPTMAFSPDVWRLMMGSWNYWDPVRFHGADGDEIRPPRPDEAPKLRYLAYGTSITHGSRAAGPHLTYVSQAAQRLGVDLINLGVGGSALCEPELADYIAARRDWHFATLALSVNMLAQGFTRDEFYERVSYMINTVAGSDASRPVACITLYPWRGDMGEQFREDHHNATSKEYRQALRDAVDACPHENAHLIEGPDILTDIGGLSPDLVHPADNGMIRMGENLARHLKPLIDSLA